MPFLISLTVRGAYTLVNCVCFICFQQHPSSPSFVNSDDAFSVLSVYLLLHLLVQFLYHACASKRPYTAPKAQKLVLRHRDPSRMYDCGYCRFCFRLKLLRSKHCHFCRTDITRFDHHCRWMAACIGQHNHRLFLLYLHFQLLLFVFSASLAVVIVVRSAFAYPLHDASLCFFGFTSVVFAIFVLMLLRLQYTLVLLGMTTYEYSAGFVIPPLKEKNYHNPFDLGSRWLNFRHFFMEMPSFVYSLPSSYRTSFSATTHPQTQDCLCFK
eukprot:GCRY01005128.1.p1 GENE.GCRY01005128.1~~GCRY01005128.1.p1  ORF type:complete len:268 (+),score=39.78 GCRY01005128.1:281-1084(+)